MRSRSHNDSLAKAKPRSFFRILLSDITPRSTLMIPRKFVSEWGDDLEDHVFLKAPAGSVWDVALERTNGDVWLENGWPEFATHYSLCFGYFLVFRYEGKSHFHVIILDNSAVEIDYPLSSQQPYRNRDIRKQKAVAMTDDHVEGHRRNGRILMSITKTKSISACVKGSYLGGQDDRQKYKENAFTTSNKTDSSEDLEETDESDNSRDLETSVESDDSDYSYCRKGNKRLKQVTSGAKEVRLVNAFKSKNPYFKVKMQPSYVSGKCFLGVPRNFMKEYISECHCDVILQDWNGMTWAVKCNVFSSCAQFGVGWRKFAVANGLAVGDICTFELSNCFKNLFKVTIFRAASKSF